MSRNMKNWIEDIFSAATLLGLGYALLVWGTIGEALAGL